MFPRRDRRGTIIDDGQTEKLMAGREVKPVAFAEAPRRITARRQRPRANRIEIPAVAGERPCHRQRRHGVTDFALPELFVAALLVSGAILGRTVPHQDIGVRPQGGPQVGVRRLDGHAQFLAPLCREKKPGMDAARFFEPRHLRVSQLWALSCSNQQQRARQHGERF